MIKMQFKDSKAMVSGIAILNTGDEDYIWKLPKDEWAIALGYTSGTTGIQRVVYHHRGSYLMATGSTVAWNMPNN